MRGEAFIHKDRETASQRDVVGTRKGCGPGLRHSPAKRSPSAARPPLASPSEPEVSTRQDPAGA